MFLVQSLNSISTIPLVQNERVFLFELNSSLLCYNLLACKEEWKEKIPTQHLLLSDDKYLFPYKQYHKLLKVDKNNGEVIQELSADVFPIAIKQGYIFCEYGENNEYYFSAIDTHTFNLEKKWNINNLRIRNVLDDVVIAQNNTNIFCQTLSTGHELWCKEFPVNIDKIETFGDDLVLVALSGVHTKGMVCGLTAKDGAILWEVEGGYLHVFEDRIFVVGYHTDVPYQLKEINPVTGKATVYVLADILAKNGLDYRLQSDYQVVGNLIYISFFYHKTLVIINLEELKLEWIHKVETNAEWINEPKVAGNRLYVLDEGNTLHVFEKELK